MSRLRGVGGSLLRLFFAGGSAVYRSSGAVVDGMSFQKYINKKFVYSVGGVECGRREWFQNAADGGRGRK
jgi:hypothetical protein